ncbi:MAG: alkaline phosphatase family protein [Planctomycetaceae bacterium]
MSRRHVVRPILAALALSGILLPVSGPPAIASGGVPSLSRVFVIVGENTEITKVNANSMPYLTRELRPESAWLTDYWGITHFSTANYVAMTSGQYTPCEQFDYPPARCHQDVPNLFGELSEADVSWHVWNESMAEPCGLVDNGSSKTLNHYAVKHDPAVYYDDVVATNGTWDGSRSQLCRDNVVAMGSADLPNDTSAFDATLAEPDADRTMPRFNFIVPNMCEDAHDNCSPGLKGGPLTQFDAFLRREVPKIMDSPAFDERSILIVTFDEGASTGGGGGSNDATPCSAWDTCPNAFHGGGHIVFAVVGDPVVAGDAGGFADHYSFLRTMEDAFALGQHAGAAAAADPIVGIWRA